MEFLAKDRSQTVSGVEDEKLHIVINYKAHGANCHKKDAHFNPKLADGKDDSNMASVGSRERLAPSMNNEHLGTLEAVTLGKENAVAEVVEVGERMRNSNTTITANTLLTNDGKVLVRRSPKLVVTNQPKVVASIVTTQRLNNSSPSSEANVTKRSEPDTLINTSYVIENNFVADKKLKVSWTMASPPTQNAQRRLFTKHAEASTGSDEENNTDRDERERARISEKDDVSEDDTDERLMELSEVTLAPSTVSSTETAGARAVGNDYCENCTMHKSWRTVMAFGPAMSQLKVTADEFANG
ncbi:unnamed protein product [Toxocara canis]|uniref:GATA-type domain-containing protein n=1 Tax=Toxocara canis TaxID=6265 RepID=A0A183UZJ5_TOXCA|nr:unnamed protein product [Toxocara canis]